MKSNPYAHYPNSEEPSYLVSIAWAREFYVVLFGEASADALCLGDTLWCVHNTSESDFRERS